MFEHPPTMPPPFSKIISSLALHCILIALLIHMPPREPIIVTAGAGSGLQTRIDLTYRPGGASLQVHPRLKAASSRAAHVEPAPAAIVVPAIAPLATASVTPLARTLPPARPHLGFSQPTPTLSETQPHATANSTTGLDLLGSGNIQIALTTYSPSPRPDLSRLPNGMQGDVVLDVTIDPSGKVAEVAVVRALGYGIDESVIDTVRTWLFRPATKDGVPVSSAQDVLFHYGPV